MPNVKVTLHPAVRAIAKIEKELRTVRKQVGKIEQKKIDLELKTLQELSIALKRHCKGFIQTFAVKKSG
jgi:t-SNARE complex subunit (syntaxin)